MDAKPESLEELKLILSTIAQIREISLEVDFNLVDIEERYRTLHMYDIKTTTQEVETCNSIRNKCHVSPDPHLKTLCRFV